MAAEHGATGMQVLIVSQYFWPENFRVNEVAESLARAGCAVHVLTGPPNYPDGQVYAGYSALALTSERRGEVSVHRVPVVPRGGGGALMLALNYLSYVASACVLGPWLLRGARIDVVLVYAPGPILQAIPGLWLGLLKRAPVVTWVQDLWPESLVATQYVRNPLALRAIARVVRWIYRRSDLLLVQSQSFIQPVTTMAGGTPVIYHPNPGDLPAQGARTDAPSLRLNPGFNVVFAGNLGTVQALETILEAAAQTRDSTDLWWVIIGSGSRSEWLQQQVQRRGLSQVVLPGRFPPEAMPQILEQAAALLVTLVRSPIMTLTVPSKIQAYLAAGKPIVASLDGEGARVVVEAGAGIACPAEDAPALAEAVLRLKALPANEREVLGRAGYNYYLHHFAPEVLTQRLLAHLRGCRLRPEQT